MTCRQTVCFAFPPQALPSGNDLSSELSSSLLLKNYALLSTLLCLIGCSCDTEAVKGKLSAGFWEGSYLYTF